MIVRLFCFLSIVYLFNCASVEECQINENGESVCNIVPKGANSQGKPLEASLQTCKDRHQQCTSYQQWGECEKNPGWMIVNCPNSCNSCHLLDPALRCSKKFLNISEEPGISPGSLNQMFSTLQERVGHKYPITIHSTDPWVVTLENFVEDIEIQELLKTVSGRFERSTDTGTMNAFGEVGRVVSTGRTSMNAWCRQDCDENPHVANIVSKIEEAIGVPRNNYESFQVLRYENGQKYNTHHDASKSQSRLTCGVRILTFFMYLSDVEEGGETAFPHLNIAVKPKKGMGLIWPSVQVENTDEIDQRTSHEARPVLQGVKMAANAWVHMHDFRKANLWGCTGAFDNL